MKIISILSLLFFSIANVQDTDTGTNTDNGVQKTEPYFLDDAELRVAFSGTVQIGFYRDYLERYGSIQFEERYNADGTVYYEGGGHIVTGEWEIFGGRICFDYDDERFLPGCFAVTTDKGCFYSHESSHPDDSDQVIAKEWWIFSHVKDAQVDCVEAALIS